jgi:hypothetical protein
LAWTKHTWFGRVDLVEPGHDELCLSMQASDPA